MISDSELVEVFVESEMFVELELSNKIVDVVGEREALVEESSDGVVDFIVVLKYMFEVLVKVFVREDK